MSSKKDGKLTQIKGLKYVALARKAKVPEGVEEKDFEEWKRVKVRIPSKEVEVKKEGADKNDKPEKVKVYEIQLRAPNEDGVATDTIITSIGELREHMKYGCKVRLVLEFRTFWAQKTADDSDVRKCGYKVTCNMIEVVERGTSKVPAKLKWDDLMGGDGDDDDAVVSKPKNVFDNDDEDSAPVKVKKPTKQAKEESDDDKKSESEDEKPVVKASSKTTSKKPVKEESDDDAKKSESEDEKPVVKASSKTASKKPVKEESDDEDAKKSESEDEKPVVKKPAPKSSKTKGK